MTEPIGDLSRQAEEFGQELVELLTSTLPDLPSPPVKIVTHGSRAVIRPPERPKRLPLYVNGAELASLELSYSCQLDSYGEWLAIERSTFGLYANLDRTPVLRIDFLRYANKVPAAHINVHAHRGALSHLLSRSGHPSPHDMSSLHIPLGGHRFRPCLEDFIEFLISECKFDKKRYWRHNVKEGRARWRLRQAAAVARDEPDVSVRVLEKLGYKVTPPATAPADPFPKVLHDW